MKKNGILNKHLSSEVAGLGHTEKIVVCDVGFPIPKGINIVDVALRKGIPTMMQTLSTILNEVIVEKVIICKETEQISPDLFNQLKQLFCKQEFEVVDFEEFRLISTQSKFVVRTGEVIPYANIILVAASGVNEYNRQFDLSTVLA